MSDLDRAKLSAVVGYDLAAAINENRVELSAMPTAIVLELTGENDGHDWHWIVSLDGGAFAYVTGGCDYTGWDCQSNCHAYEAETLDAAIALVGEVERAVFVEMLASGEPIRANGGFR